MLQVTRASAWRSEYSFHDGAVPVASWKKETWKSGGHLTVGNEVYRVHVGGWGYKHTLHNAAGAVVATADRVGRKNWTVDGENHTWHLRRASMWNANQNLVDTDGFVRGFVRKTSNWKFNAEAELPGMSLLTQLFVITSVIILWEQAASSGAG